MCPSRGEVRRRHERLPLRHGRRLVGTGGHGVGHPLSAGIPHGDEQFIDPQAVQVIPYLSHGLLTEQDAQAAAAKAIHDPYPSVERATEGSLSGDELAFANAVVAAAESLHDPLTADEQGGAQQVDGDPVRRRSPR